MAFHRSRRRRPTNFWSHHRRRLRLESLEPRLALANVEIFQLGDTLHVIGDAESSDVELPIPSSDDVSVSFSGESFRITGNNGTTLLFGSSTDLTEVTIPRVGSPNTINVLFVDLLSDNDRLSLDTLPSDVSVTVEGGEHNPSPVTTVFDGRDTLNTSSFVPGGISVPLGDLLIINDAAAPVPDAEYVISGNRIFRNGVPFVSYSEFEQLRLNTGPGKNDVTADLNAGSLPAIVQVEAGAGDPQPTDNRFQVNGSPAADKISIGDLAATGGGGLPTGPEVDRGILIDNDVPTATVGHFEVTPNAGGSTSDSGVTVQGATTLVNRNFIFDFTNYVDVGSNGDAIDLANTTITQPPTLVGPDKVVSQGEFLGPEPEQIIQWRAETRFDNGRATMFNTVTFTSNQPLGNLQFINYLDEDVLFVNDDLLYPTGTPGSADFRLFTLDNEQRVGFSQGGVYSPGPGLVNATYDGYAADEYSELKSVIASGGGATYSVDGNINTTRLPPRNDPQLGQTYGLADVTTAMAWTVDPEATTATITTFLELIAQDPGGGRAHFELSGFQRLWARGQGGNDVIDNRSSVPGLLEGGEGDDVINSVVSSPSELVLNAARPDLTTIRDVNLVLGGPGADQMFAGANNGLASEISFLIGDFVPGLQRSDGTFFTFDKVLSSGDTYVASSPGRQHGFVALADDAPPAQNTFLFPGSDINFLLKSQPGGGRFIYPADLNPLARQLQAYTRPVAANPVTTGAIAGVKFSDLNRNAVRDPGEPGIAGSTIYVDANGDGVFSSGEPSAQTGPGGEYIIPNLPPGTNYLVREAEIIGLFQTLPGPSAPVPFAYSNVIVKSNQVTGGLDFGSGFAEPIERELGPLDVNQDGTVSAGDALSVVNELNAHGTRQVLQGLAASGEGEQSAESGGPDPRLDVNGDSYVTPLDALLIINVLNAGGGASPTSAALPQTGGEGEAAAASPATAGTAAVARNALYDLLAMDITAATRRRKSS